MPPPAKVLADADVRLIVPVPVTVRFVDAAKFQGVPLPFKVQVPEPIVTVFVAVPEVENEGTVTL